MRKVMQSGRWAVCAALLLFGISTNWVGGGVMQSKLRPEIPIRTVKVAIEKSAHPQYVRQVKAFAHAFGFSTRFSQSSPDPADVLVQMWRNDVKMIAGMASKYGARDLAYELSFYGNGSNSPSYESLQVLVEGVRHFMGQIDRAVVTETK
jgi:hypothetical protein